MRCSSCDGKGRVMSLGMIYKKCESCDEGNIIKIKSVAIDKRSASYRAEIKKIMESNEVSREEAVKVFEDEFEKIV
jgi:hypothetical protein